MSATDSWLAKRWLAPILEDRALRNSVRRGKVIARKGWVKKLTISKGSFTAEVVNDHSERHSVRVRVDLLEPEVWTDAGKRIADEAVLAADLLSGRLTERVVAVFEDLGHFMFPLDVPMLRKKSYCSCYASLSICTHLAATHLEFARLITADPLMLLDLHGREHQAFIEEVLAQRTDSGGGATAERGEAALEPASALLDGFWDRGVIPQLAFRIGQGALADDEALPVLGALGPGPGETQPEAVVAVLRPLMRTGRLRIEAIIDQAASQDTVAIPQPDPTEARSLDEVLIAAAHQHGSLTSGFVADALGIRPREARQYLKWLVEEGRLVVVGRARGTKYYPAGSAELAALEGAVAEPEPSADEVVAAAG